MRKFIFGSDWWTDCDDVVATKILAKAVTDKKAVLLGAGINACMQYSGASFYNYLKYCGLDNVPIGIDHDAVDYGGEPPYQERLARESSFKPENSEFADAAELYIKLLSEADEKVEIIEIGFPQVLAKVLESEPLLFKEKVAKIWMMAGKWDDNPGKEHNFAKTSRSARAGHYVCKNSPVPIVFLGFEVGYPVIVGSKVSHDDKLYQVFVDFHSPNGRYAWDSMLVQLAITGDVEKAGYRLVKGTAYVDENTGENYFEKNKNGLHGYVEKIYPDDYYRDIIDNLIS